MYNLGSMSLSKFKEQNPSILKGDLEKIRKLTSSSPTSVSKCNSIFLSDDGSILNAIFNA